MIRKAIKVALWGAGIVIALVFALLAIVLVDWSRSSARVEKDRLIQQKPSPDGKVVAELYTHTTAMWGGPDTLFVALRKAEDRPGWGNKVYVRTYECSDFSAFSLEWNTPKELTIEYGECSPSSYANPQETAQQNKILESSNGWDGVTIHYADTHHTATH